jgi:hypothetical protein
MKEHEMWSLTYGLCNNPVSISDYTVLNDILAAYFRLFTQKFTWRYCGKPTRGLLQTLYPGIHLERLWKTTRYPDRTIGIVP